MDVLSILQEVLSKPDGVNQRLDKLYLRINSMEIRFENRFETIEAGIEKILEWPFRK